jgi:hypothetical protein
MRCIQTKEEKRNVFPMPCPAHQAIRKDHGSKFVALSHPSPSLFLLQVWSKNDYLTNVKKVLV